MPREQRREQLLDASLRLISRHGFGAVSMEAVAREVGIAKTVVYDAFSNRPELLRALLEREQERALGAVAAAIPSGPGAGDPSELLATSIATMLEAVRESPDTWRLILLPADGTPPAMRADVERHRQAILRQIEPIVAWGLGQLELGSLDPELTAQAILTGAETAARLTLTEPDRFPPERIAAFVADLVGALISPKRSPTRRAAAAAETAGG